MNFDQILSVYRTKACILSVEDYDGGRYGKIRSAVLGQPMHSYEKLH